MASTSPSETKQSSAGTAPLGEHGGSGSLSRNRFLALLDGFLSESLRGAPPSDLSRYRVMVGAALFLLIVGVLYVFTPLPLTMRVSLIVTSMGYLAALVLIRRSTSPVVPAWLVCGSLVQGLIVPTVAHGMPLSSIHAVTMLLPALAVYLMGPRMGLILTVVLASSLGVLHPLLYIPSLKGAPLVLGHEYLWPLHLFAALSFFGGWGLSSLHGAARDAAQRSLERTLKELRESEGKLVSLLENTEDPIASLDLEGRVVTANASLKRLYLQRFGVPLEVGKPFFAPLEPELLAMWQPRWNQLLAGQGLHYEEEHKLGDTYITMDVSVSPIVDPAGQVIGATLFGRNVTARKEAEARLGEMHRTMVEVSRQAGMAEVATGVLHNVGNTLNSVNISTSVLADQLRQSRVGNLVKAIQLLREHSTDLATFLSQDAQGQKLPGYLSALTEHLVGEREAMSREVLALIESVEHIKSIVSMQQKHARTGGTIEELSVPQLIDEALRLHAVSFERLGITIERDYATVPLVMVDRHKLLQILINLLSNARHALVDSNTQDKRLIIRIRRSEDERRLLIDVQDNGEGIAPENMPRLFTQGFTTKKTGHGFGLHISALAAAEMKGRLSCTSPGPGQGATFTLELPMADEEASS